MIIRVKSLKGKTCNDISIDASSKILSLCEKIEHVTGVAVDLQRLLCRGKVLKVSDSFVFRANVETSRTQNIIQNEKTIQDYGLKDQSTIHLVTKKPQSNTTMQTSAAAPTTSSSNTSSSENTRVTMHTHALELPADTSPEQINNLVSGIINRLGGTGAHVNVMSSSTPHVMTSSTSTSGSNDATPREPLSNTWFDELGRLNDQISTYSYTSTSNLQMSASPIHSDNNLKTLANALLEGHSAMHALQLPLLEISEALRRESSLNMSDRIGVTVAASRLAPALSDMSSLCSMLSRALEGVTTRIDDDDDNACAEEEKTEEKDDTQIDTEALDDVLAEFEVDVNADAEAEALSQLELSRKASQKEKSRKRKERRRACNNNTATTRPKRLSMDDLRPENVVFETIPKSERNDFVASLREDARALRMGSRTSDKNSSKENSSAYRELFEHNKKQ